MTDLFSRFECKYLVDPAILPRMRRNIAPFVRYDKFAAHSPAHRYAVSSLYLDSPDLELYSQTVAGERERFKLRVRTYSDDPSAPVFLEVKQKFDRAVRKRRVAVTREQARAVLCGRPLGFLDELAPDARSALEFFNYCMSQTSARPIARVKYCREAFEALDNEPVRITIDSDLMHAATMDDNLSHADGPWTATSAGGAILELKYTDRLPSWARDLVRILCINQRAVPKYVLSIDHMLHQGRRAAMTIGGVTLPPLGA